MPGSTECIVSVGSDIKLQWNQTRDGILNFSIRIVADGNYAQGQKKLFRHTENWDNNRNRTVQFQLAAKYHRGNSQHAEYRSCEDRGSGQDERIDRSNDQNSESEDNQNSASEDEQDESEDSENEDVLNESQDSNGQTDRNKDGGSDTNPESQQRGVNSVSTHASCAICQKIREKIEKGFGKQQQKVQQYHSVWMNNPEELFGNAVPISSEQWSFKALTDTEENLDQERVPFHKINLAAHLQKRIEESQLPELTCRKTMLQTIYPGFEKMQRKDREPLYRRFERYIEQGQAYILISTGNAGILLTVAGLLSRANLAHLSKAWKSCACRLHWLTVDILEQSKQYEEAAIIIRTYMQRTPKRRAYDLHESREKRPRSGFSDRRLNHSFYPTNGQSQLGSTPPEHYEDRVPDDQPSSVSLPTPTLSQASSLVLSPSALWDEIETVFAGNWLSDHAYFLMLFYSLGGCVPKLFDRSLSPQRRWTESGTQQLLTPAQTQLDPQLTAILSSPDRFARALDSVKDLGFVGESSSVSLHGELYTRLSQVLTKHVKEQWSIKALRWLCFIFPRHGLWENSPGFPSIVRSLQPLLDHLVRSVEEASMPRSLKEEVSEALLAASTVSDVRSQALSLVAGLLGDESPPHLYAELALQRSILFRLDGDFKNSERVIHDFCCGCETLGQSCLPTYFQQRQKQIAELSHRQNALHGLIHRSHLENLVQCEQYELAKEQIDDWQLPRTASPMEWDILPSRTLTTSKIFRSHGAFKCAQQNLELCAKVIHLHDPARVQVLCQLADVYNDLGFPASASELLTPRIETGRKQNITKTKSFRRLLVSLVETNVQKRQFESARADLEQLSIIFSKLSHFDVSDQLLHVRALVASARICHIQEEFGAAIERWDTTLRHVRSYNSFEGEGFTYSGIYLSQSHAYLELGEHEMAQDFFGRGKAILDRRGRDYWIPTFPAWVTEVLPKLQLMEELT